MENRAINNTVGIKIIKQNTIEQIKRRKCKGIGKISIGERNIAKITTESINKQNPAHCTRLCHLVSPLEKRKIIQHCWVAQFTGNAHWIEPLSLFTDRAPHSTQVWKRVPGAPTGVGNCSPGSSRLYCLGVSLKKAKESGNERPRLRAS